MNCNYCEPFDFFGNMIHEDKCPSVSKCPECGNRSDIKNGHRYEE
jgi:hypothetical protein